MLRTLGCAPCVRSDIAKHFATDFGQALFRRLNEGPLKHE